MALRQNLELLASTLDLVVEEQVGTANFELVETLRRLAKERRAGLPDAELQLVRRIEALSGDEARVAIRALSLYFDLANVAEDCQRIRVLRDRQRRAGEAPIKESLAEAVSMLEQAGLDGRQMQALLDRLRIELVSTAHPTEAKRRTTRSLLRRLREHLKQLDRDDLLPVEREEQTNELRSLLTVLWQTDMLRPRPPQVLDEVGRGLFFTAGLWDVVPQIYAHLRRALRQHYPDDHLDVPCFLRIGTWMGGDRDGNPNVTSGVTQQTLALLRRTTIERHLQTCRELRWVLVMSRRQAAADERIRLAVEEAGKRWPELKARLDQVSPHEICRAWMAVIRYRLEQALAEQLLAGSGKGGYASSEELAADVQLLAESVAAHGGERIVETYVRPWLDRIRTFGFYFARVDVRQDSQEHEQVVGEMLASAALCDDYTALDEPQKQRQLLKALAIPAPWPREMAGLSEEAADTISLFRLLADVVRSQGTGPLGGYVISMTHHVSDVLEVLLMWSWAWREIFGQQAQVPYLPIVPLFETIDDLHRAGDVLAELFESSTYAAYVRSRDEPEQIVMVGYSDSTKDGGYVAAVWGLDRAMHRLAEVAEWHKVRLITFHGRGGALGRGGGPAARAIRSLPPVAVKGAFRITEQGEVLAERYDDPDISMRHLEQVCWATMLVSGEPTTSPKREWVEIMERLSKRALAHYRSLIEDPGFLTFFDRATPIAEIERLPFGSRPAKRRARKSLADLRAIPWTFAWTQCRQILPAWFGLGTAVTQLAEKSPDAWTQLQEMYREWRFFQALVDNAELALAKADIGIARRYMLLDEGEGAERLRDKVTSEYNLTRGAVLMIINQPELLAGTPWLQRSIGERNPYVDPLNFLQVELLKRLRKLEDGESVEAAALRDLVRMSIQGVAAGVRTTG
jgi:phosphoenolpyruvate carboxylase